MPLVQCTVERRADPLSAQTRFAPPLLYFLTPISFVSQQQPTSKKEGDDPQPSAASRTLVVIVSQWQPLPLRPSWCTCADAVPGAPLSSRTRLLSVQAPSPVQRRTEVGRRVRSDLRRVGRNERRPAATWAVNIATPRGARGWQNGWLGLVGERSIQLRLQIRLALVAVARLPIVTFGRQRRTPSSLRVPSTR